MYISNGMLLNHEKEILFGATWMNLKGIKPSETTHIHKDKHCVISCICEI